MKFHSRRLAYFFGTAAIFFTIFLVFRALFVTLFISELQASGGDLFRAFWIGIRFDLRLAILTVLPVMALFLVPVYNPLKKPGMVRYIRRYFMGISLLYILFYTADLGHYGYLSLRTDISALKLLENPLISLQMVWETYPVLITVVFIVIAMWLIRKMFLKTEMILRKQGQGHPRWKRLTLISVSGLVIVFSLWGTFRQYMLLWSDAHFSEDPFVTAAALNPVLYLNDTRKFSDNDYDTTLVRKYYPVVAAELGVTDPGPDTLDFSRLVKACRKQEKQPNIVIIFLESVGLNRLGAAGNPLDPTPELDQLAENGILFRRFYIPMVGTARSVFGMLTGIPDVASVETASSNPRTVDQYMLVNSLENYEKFYLIGGSTSWRNIRGLLNRNIPDLRIIEQDDLDYPRVDVWGISDHDLFTAAHRTFSELDPKRPFFAVVQTATNHKPYTIPGGISDFKIRTVDEEQLKNAGFKSVEQYNAMRLLDHAVGYFFRLAKGSEYYRNTVFILYGDHGTSDPHAHHMPPSDYQLKLRSYNVPLIIYGPGIVDSGIVRDDVAQLTDLMPTVCGLAGVSYENRTMGQDLLSSGLDPGRAALIINRKLSRQNVGLVTDSLYVSMNKDGSRLRIYDLYAVDPLEEAEQPSQELSDYYLPRIRGLYETAKYLQYHNRK